MRISVAHVANDPINATDPSGRKKIGIKFNSEGYFIVGIKSGFSVSYDTETGNIQTKLTYGGGGGLGGGVGVSPVIEPSSVAPSGYESEGQLALQGDFGPLSAEKVLGRVENGEQVYSVKDGVDNSSVEVDNQYDKPNLRGRIQLKIKAAIVGEGTSIWNTRHAGQIEDDTIVPPPIPDLLDPVLKEVDQ